MQKRSASGVWAVLLGAAVFICVQAGCAQVSRPAIGIFEGQSDIGKLNMPGSGTFNQASGTYPVTAAGTNIWATADTLHYVWKKVSGDVSLTADVDFPVKAANAAPHRKAVLMLRQDLEPDAAYADAAYHGSGMTALQFRHTKAGASQDIELNTSSAARFRIVKRGDEITLLVSTSGEALHQVGATTKLHLVGEFYVGLGVCSHNADMAEKAVFSHVELKTLAPLADRTTKLFSSLQTVPVANASRRGVMAYTVAGNFQAPNWTHDGSTLLFVQDGKIMTVPAVGGEPKALNIGDADHCNGSHGFSPDGKWLAISCATPGKPESRVYLVSAAGGTPRLLTQGAKSYWHAWSADGSTIYFTRPNAGGINIYSIPVEGGEEKAVTTGAGINDDPDCSPDGKYVYFHSDRSGSVQIWRMRPNGTGAEQMTHDENMRSRTPHISPDGKMMVMLSYGKDVTGGLLNKPVSLRVMPLDGNGATWTIAEFTGGSGSINVPSWSPDSTQVAFVSYLDLPVEDAITH